MTFPESNGALLPSIREQVPNLVAFCLSTTRAVKGEVLVSGKPTNGRSSKKVIEKKRDHEKERERKQERALGLAAKGSGPESAGEQSTATEKAKPTH